MQIPAEQPRVAGMAGLIAAFFFAIVNSLKEILASIFTGLQDILASIFTGLKDILASTFDGLKNLLASTFDGLKNLLSGSITEILGFISTSLKDILSLSYSKLYPLLSSLSNYIDFLKEFFINISYQKVGLVALIVALGMSFFAIFRLINHFLGPV